MSFGAFTVMPDGSTTLCPGGLFGEGRELVAEWWEVRDREAPEWRMTYTSKESARRMCIGETEYVVHVRRYRLLKKASKP